MVAGEIVAVVSSSSNRRISSSGRTEMGLSFAGRWLVHSAASVKWPTNPFSFVRKCFEPGGTLSLFPRTRAKNV